MADLEIRILWHMTPISRTLSSLEVAEVDGDLKSKDPKSKNLGSETPGEVEASCSIRTGVIMWPGKTRASAHFSPVLTSITHWSETGSFSNGQNQSTCPSAEKTLLWGRGTRCTQTLLTRMVDE